MHRIQQRSRCLAAISPACDVQVCLNPSLVEVGHNLVHALVEISEYYIILDKAIKPIK